MDDRTYSVRVEFHNGNPITLELKGCGNLYIIPGREYFFVNAPFNFINYLAQLKRCGISYRLTNDSNGCYLSMDLKDYNRGDPRYEMSRIRKLNNPVIEEPKKEEPQSEKGVVLSSDDIAPRDEIVESKAEQELNQMIAEDLQASEQVPEQVSIQVEEPVAEVSAETAEEPAETEEENAEGPKVYTEEQLSKFSKAMLLEISADYGLECSDINTKKEIRDAIIAAQNK